MPPFTSLRLPSSLGAHPHLCYLVPPKPKAAPSHRLSLLHSTRRCPVGYSPWSGHWCVYHSSTWCIHFADDHACGSQQGTVKPSTPHLSSPIILLFVLSLVFVEGLLFWYWPSQTPSRPDSFVWFGRCYTRSLNITNSLSLLITVLLLSMSSSVISSHLHPSAPQHAHCVLGAIVLQGPKGGAADTTPFWSNIPRWSKMWAGRWHAMRERSLGGSV